MPSVRPLPHYVPQLSDCEKYSLSWVRPYGHIVKISLPNEPNIDESLLRSVLRAHFISFLQYGPNELHEALPLLQQIDRMHEQVRVVFVGPSKSRDALALRFRTMKETRMRPWVLYNYARLAEAVAQARHGYTEGKW